MFVFRLIKKSFVNGRYSCLRRCLSYEGIVIIHVEGVLRRCITKDVRQGNRNRLLAISIRRPIARQRKTQTCKPIKILAGGGLGFSLPARSLEF